MPGPADAPVGLTAEEALRDPPCSPASAHAPLPHTHSAPGTLASSTCIKIFWTSELLRMLRN